MQTITITRALGLGITAALAASALTFTPASAAPAPDGSTAVITGLTGGTPGVADEATLTVKAPGGAAVVGADISLTVDHGFFTSGESKPLVVGAPAGNLVQGDTTLNGTTNALGQIDFSIGIARDGGFDDDGLVTATVKVASGPAAAATATWNSTNPLNGGVAITRAPASEQENPVNPALAGNRTFYDVFALDQFGNRTGVVPMELDYTRGNIDPDIFDNSGWDTESDFDTFGDFWVSSFRAQEVDITATWEEAPTSTLDAQGTRVPGTKDATASITDATYELNFNASRMSISSSAADTVRVGTAVTQTVRVIDQQGNPVNGYQVRFLRYGPDDISGDVVATRTTNALGEATYSFVGKKRGRATITAEVTDGDRRRELTGTAAFGAGVRAKLAKDNSKAKKGTKKSADRVAVSAGSVAKGARVNLYKVVKGKQKLVGTKKLNKLGTVVFSVRDRNRNAKTTYVAIVRSTSTSVADQSNVLKTR